MLNAEISIPLKLSSILVDLELSVSLAEKLTKMEDFISTLSSCSRDSLGQDLSVSLMLTDTTQILSVAMAHQRRVGTMQRRMETLSQEAWKGRAETEFLTLARPGLESSWQKIETAFLKQSRNWILDHFACTLDPLEATLIGGIGQTEPSTNIRQEFYLTRADIPILIHGYNKLWWDIDIQVRHLARRSGGPFGGGTPPLPGGPSPPLFPPSLEGAGSQLCYCFNRT